MEGKEERLRLEFSWCQPAVVPCKPRTVWEKRVPLVKGCQALGQMKRTSFLFSSVLLPRVQFTSLWLHVTGCRSLCKAADVDV